MLIEIITSCTLWTASLKGIKSCEVKIEYARSRPACNAIWVGISGDDYQVKCAERVVDRNRNRLDSNLNKTRVEAMRRKIIKLETEIKDLEKDD